MCKNEKNKKEEFVNVASTAGLSPRPKLNWYNASKAVDDYRNKAMVVELALLRVNAIAPVAGKHHY